MTNICFYISDYGYGHASRDIAIVRGLVAKLRNIKIYVKTGKPYNFVKQSLKQVNVKVISQENDIGIILKKNSVVVDKKETKKLLKRWSESWDIYIQKEKRFCEKNKIDVIISDISPQPFAVGNELGIPTIAISNFTWYDIYYDMFGKIEEVERIREFYQLATIALILPFNDNMKIFSNRKETSLISREITVDRDEMRGKYGIQDDEIIVYVGMGMSLNTASSYVENLKNMVKSHVRILISCNSRLFSNDFIKIPKTETETQNYINMCDLVVSKAGYSTISEAIRARVPMFLLKREGFKEDKILTRVIEKYGIGKTISSRPFFSGEWINEIEGIEEYKRNFDNLDSRLRKDGIPEVVDAISEVIEK